MNPIHELWFTLLIGDTKIPVYLPYLDRPLGLPYLGPVARRPDESEEEWDSAEGDSRCDKIMDSKKGDESWPLHCLLHRCCQDCEEDLGETGETYLRNRTVLSLCEKHKQPGDLRLGIDDFRTREMTPLEVGQARRVKVRELKAKGLTTRQIAKELGISQSSVQYHIGVANE